MTPLILDVPGSAVRSEADETAAGNLRANADALRLTQPDVSGILLSTTPDDSWVFARDGSLTALDPGERWVSGCSVPLLAARAMLKTLDPTGGAACFLAPVHAAQIRVALGRLQAEQSLVCVIPDTASLAVMARCEDFSAEIARGRLWFAAGDGWAGELAGILSDTPGLPAPGRFIRMPDADPASIEKLIADAQRVFAEQNARRAAQIAEMRRRWAPGTAATPRLCVIARSTFRLWDDAGHALLTALSADGDERLECHRFDPDAPAGSSPLALAMLASTSHAVVAADIARADAPNLVADDLPWITWVTSGRVPSFAAAGTRDRLLLADARWLDGARRAGWPTDRVAQAAWPRMPGSVDAVHQSPIDAPPFVAVIADTGSLDAPPALSDYSSHCLLWDRIRVAVARDPLALPEDVHGWLRQQAAADGIADDTLDAGLFVNRLIVPAYQQAVAATLIAAGLPVRLYGTGWADLPAFKAFAAGPVTTRTALRALAGEAAAVVHVWPTGGAHPVDAVARHVIRRGGRGDSLVRAAERALASPPPIQPASAVPLSAPIVLQQFNRPV